MRLLRKPILRAGSSILACLAVAAVVAACGSSSNSGKTGPSNQPTATAAGAKPATGPAIKVAGLFTNSPFAFGADAEQMTKAVFANVNSHGGIHGRKISFRGGNDGNSTTTATQLAHQAVNGGAVAMVGSASFIDCSINAGYYKANNIVSITAVGVPEQCYTSANIASVEPSPYTQLTASLYYAYKYLHKTKQCLFQPLTPGAGPYIKAAIAAYEHATGNQLVISDSNIAASPSGSVSAANIDPLLIRAKDAGCQTFFYGGANEPTAALILAQMQREGMTNVDFLTVSITYVQQLVAAGAKYGVPTYAITSLYPFTSKSPKNKAFLALAKQHNVNVTEFSADAYVAANWLVSALKAIKGPVTAKSVQSYFKAGHPYTTPMSPTPLVFGNTSTHQNVISKLTVVKLTPGGWKLAVFGMKVPS